MVLFVVDPFMLVSLLCFFVLVPFLACTGALKAESDTACLPPAFKKSDGKLIVKENRSEGAVTSQVYRAYVTALGGALAVMILLILLLLSQVIDTGPTKCIHANYFCAVVASTVALGVVECPPFFFLWCFCPKDSLVHTGFPRCWMGANWY